MQHDPNTVEAVARAVREAWRDREGLRSETMEWEVIEDDERADCLASATAALDTLTALSWQRVPEGWQVMPDTLDDGMRRATWRAQYDRRREVDANVADATDETITALTERRVACPVQRDQDERAYAAMLAAAPKPGDAG